MMDDADMRARSGANCVDILDERTHIWPAVLIAVAQ
jgi:hypothetical protein